MSFDRLGDDAPPTSPSLQSAVSHERLASVIVADPPSKPCSSKQPSTRGAFLFAILRRLKGIPPVSLPKAPRAVLIAITDYTNNKALAWPALPTLASTAGYSISGTSRALKWLIAHGWLVQKRVGIGRTTSMYEVHTDGWGTERDDAQAAAVTPAEGAVSTPGETCQTVADEAPESAGPLTIRGVSLTAQTSHGEQSDSSPRAVCPVTVTTNPLTDPHNYPLSEPHETRALADSRSLAHGPDQKNEAPFVAEQAPEPTAEPKAPSPSPSRPQGTLFGDIAPASKPVKKAPRARKARVAAVETTIAPDWKPSAAHEAFAAEHGLDLALEVVGFLGWADGRKALSWNGTFTTRLANAAKWAKQRGGSGNGYAGKSAHYRPLQTTAMREGQCHEW